MIEGLKLLHLYKLHGYGMLYKENIRWKSIFDPYDPNETRLTFNPVNVIEGLKLMHLYKLHGYAM